MGHLRPGPGSASVVSGWGHVTLLSHGVAQSEEFSFTESIGPKQSKTHRLKEVSESAFRCGHMGTVGGVESCAEIQTQEMTKLMELSSFAS